MSRLKQTLYILLPIVLLLGVFVYDVIRITVEFENNQISYVREIAIIIALFLLYLFIDGRRVHRLRGVTKEIGKLLMVVVGITVLVSFIQIFPGIKFSETTEISIPGNSLTVLFSVMVGVGMAVMSIFTLLSIKEMLFQKRKKGTKRNFVLYLIALGGSVVLLFPFFGVDLGFASMAFYAAAIVMIVVTSFRQNWIVFLSRREKVYSIFYSAILFITFVVLSLLLTNRTFLNKAILFFSVPLERFAFLNSIYGAVYFGMAFVSTLFHLPTAEVYERKQSELSSLHNLSRLVTQVFDFQDLVNTVTHMTREVCDAQSAWLELVKASKNRESIQFEVAALNSITREQIEALMAGKDLTLRQMVVDSKKVLHVDEVSTDRRTQHMKNVGIRVGSLVSVPLISHDEIIGILHATKDIEFGFDQDDIDVITTFADHVTIAIENSRLIEQSLERERYMKEMMVAQEMQRRLLPQRFPSSAAFEVAAISEPSMEVGGDYFDFADLDGGRVGVVVGDVSGKGVSAAFYMAEVKGIFQSLSKLCQSPKELLVRANHALIENLEKKSFISLLYGILDVEKSQLQLARAGHCPMIHVSKTHKEFIRPNGLGLGLTDGEVFVSSTEEKTIRLQTGDVCLFYTDGITESKNEQGEEFGYERLAEIVEQARTLTAREIQDRILSEIRRYCGNAASNDDMTLVVVKWRGNQA